MPVLALATAERPMPASLGAILAGLGLFLTAGLLTIIGSAVRESVVPPGSEPDVVRRRRARFAITGTAIVAGLALWGGNKWWSAEAASYSRSVVYRPFDSVATIAQQGVHRRLTLSIRDERWLGTPQPLNRYNALLPDHGKLMHAFLLREPALDALAHLHPIARTVQDLDFDAELPSLPAGRYRVYGDIVHESGFAQTLVSSVEVAGDGMATSTSSDPDDSWFSGAAVPESAIAIVDLGDGWRLQWQRGDAPIVAGVERDLRFSVRDASGAQASVEPYMGMAAHIIVASRDGAVFAHLHPSGSISMAAMQKFSGDAAADPHAGHVTAVDSAIAVPYAFPKPGAYRVFVQVKRDGKVMTGAFDVDVRAGAAGS